METIVAVVAGNVLAKIRLTYLLNYVVVLPDSECGLRLWRSTFNMIFVAKKLLEQCRKRHFETDKHPL